MKFHYSYFLLFYFGFIKLVKSNGDQDLDLDKDVIFLPEMGDDFTPPSRPVDTEPRPQEPPSEQPQPEEGAAGSTFTPSPIHPEQENIPFYYNKEIFDLIRYLVDGRVYYKLIPKRFGSIRRVFRGEFEVWERNESEEFVFVVFADPGVGIPVMHIFIKKGEGFRRFIYNRSERVFYTVRSSTTSYRLQSTEMTDSSSQTDESFLSETTFLPGEHLPLTQYPPKKLTLTIPEHIRERARKRAMEAKERIETQKSSSESKTSGDTQSVEDLTEKLEETVIDVPPEDEGERPLEGEEAEIKEDIEDDQRTLTEEDMEEEPQYKVEYQEYTQESTEGHIFGTKQLKLTEEEILRDRQLFQEQYPGGQEDDIEEENSEDEEEDLPSRSTEEEVISDGTDENKENMEPQEEEDEDEGIDEGEEAEDDEDKDKEDKDKDGHGKGDDKPDDGDDGSSGQGGQGDGSTGQDSSTGENNNDFKDSGHDQSPDDKGQPDKGDHTDDSGDKGSDSQGKQKYNKDINLGHKQGETNDDQSSSFVMGQRTFLLSDEEPVKRGRSLSDGNESKQSSQGYRCSSPKKEGYVDYSNKKVKTFNPTCPDTPRPQRKPLRRSKSTNTPGNKDVSINNFKDIQKEPTMHFGNPEKKEQNLNEVKIQISEDDEYPIKGGDDDDDEDEFDPPERRYKKEDPMTQGEVKTNEHDNEEENSESDDSNENQETVIEMTTFKSDVDPEGRDYEQDYEKETDVDDGTSVDVETGDRPRTYRYATYSTNPYLRGSGPGRLPRRINI